jgi:integrase
MKIKYNILFFPERETDKNDAKLRMRVRWNKNVVNFNVGYRFFSEKWSKETQRCKRNTTNIKKISASIINSRIQFLQDKAEDVFKFFETKDHTPTISEFRDEYNIMIGKKEVSINKIDKSFFKLFDSFVEEQGKQNDWTTATFTKFNTVRKHLFGFDQQLNFELLNEDKLTDYVVYLRDVGNMKNTTIKKQLGFLKWFLNWTVEKAHTSNIIFRSYKPKLKTAEKQVIYLDKEELEKVRNYEIPESKQYLDRVRDVFLFCCYTSLRYSDVYQLKRNNIINDRIEIITQKTTDKLRIKLNSKALSILEKYSQTHFNDNKMLPVISNQRMNDYLKELCKLAEINETITMVYFIGNKRHEEEYPKFALIGTHTGRRTFICNALKNGMPVHAVMEITGHSDYKAMQPYIDIAKKDIDNMVDKYIDF